jgi:hypothetical protein
MTIAQEKIKHLGWVVLLNRGVQEQQPIVSAACRLVPRRIQMVQSSLTSIVMPGCPVQVCIKGFRAFRILVLILVVMAGLGPRQSCLEIAATLKRLPRMLAQSKVPLARTCSGHPRLGSRYGRAKGSRGCPRIKSVG